MKEIITTFKNNTNPENHNIAAEIKYGELELWKKIHQLFKEIWMQEKIPQPWKERILHALYKKGTKSDYQNYRGVLDG